MMKILIACEESQAVCKEFRKLGHEAYSCDTEPCSGGHPEWHIQGDVLPLLKQEWDMIIAFPPCTFISVAGAARMYPTKGNIDTERLKKAMLAKEFFMKIYNAECKKIAIENPVSLKIVNMPQHTQQVQPYEFGHPYSKKTRLWLKGLPNLKPTDIIVDNIVSWVNGGSKNSKGEQRKNIGVKHKAKNRSKTFLGIAKAMAEQWGTQC